jgi:hypothetical protein
LLPGLLCWIALNHPEPKILLGAGLGTVGSAVMLAVVVGTMRHFRCPALLALLFPVATALAAAVAWRSVRLRQSGWITWKRRQYRLEPGPPTGMR